MSKDRLATRLAPAQHRDDRCEHSCADFNSHPGETKPGEIESGERKSIKGKTKIEELAPATRCANGRVVARNARDRLGGRYASRLNEFYCADQDVIELAWRRLRRCPVQSRDQFLLSWVQNFLRQAAEVSECPQKINSRPAGSLRMHQAPAGIEGHKNPSGEQERPRTKVTCLAANAAVGMPVAAVLSYCFINTSGYTVDSLRSRYAKLFTIGVCLVGQVPERFTIVSSFHLPVSGSNTTNQKLETAKTRTTVEIAAHSSRF